MHSSTLAAQRLPATLGSQQAEIILILKARSSKHSDGARRICAIFHIGLLVVWAQHAMSMSISMIVQHVHACACMFMLRFVVLSCMTVRNGKGSVFS